jgi:hypothetical protein
MKTRSAVALPLWILVGSAGLAGTLAFTAVRASRVGCVSSGTADLIAVGGIAGLGLAVATLLLVGAVPRYRKALPALAAVSALVLSVYAIVTFLTTDAGSCL